MTRFSTILSVFSMALVLAATWTTSLFGQAADVPAPTSGWKPAGIERVKEQAFGWLDEVKADAAARTRANELWEALPDNAGEIEVLDCLAETFALADAEAAALAQLCSKPKDQPLPPKLPWLNDPKTRPLLAGNMRLLYGRWLVHQSLLDESREQLVGLKPDQVAAPATLLFYRGVVHHGLLEKEAGLEAIQQLLDGAEQCPRRYVAVAELLQQDLKGLEDDTLDHIARRMNDIRRRLDLGRAGERVRKIEDGVIESLDKLIKKLEEQQQQSSSSSAGGNNQPSSPAPDSQIMGGRGRGEVVKRKIGSESGWGDLPPKQREEALQQIGRDFPPHYREVIEQYFRRLAGKESD